MIYCRFIWLLTTANDKLLNFLPKLLPRFNNPKSAKMIPKNHILLLNGQKMNKKKKGTEWLPA